MSQLSDEDINKIVDRVWDRFFRNFSIFLIGVLMYNYLVERVGDLFAIIMTIGLFVGVGVIKSLWDMHKNPDEISPGI